jgi:hypothetical protein
VGGRTIRFKTINLLIICLVFVRNIGTALISKTKRAQFWKT